MNRKVLVDTKCHDLAEKFLEDMEVNDEAQMRRMSSRNRRSNQRVERPPGAQAMSPSEERFDVWQYLPDDWHEKVGDNLSAEDAVKLAHSYTVRPAAQIA